MTTPTAQEVREAVTSLRSEVAGARAPDGLLADLMAAVLAGNLALVLELIQRMRDLLGVVEAALEAVQLPPEDSA